MYTIHDAHNKGVTALACTSDSHSLISGGGEGQVRVWEVSSRGQHMVAALKEHTGTITSIKLRSNDDEVEPSTLFSLLYFLSDIFLHSV